jgi:glycosyltransferase involved in cell wall biosynthesis
MQAVIVATWIGAALSIVVIAYWSVFAWRAARDARGRPSLCEGLALAAPASGWEAVRVVIPSHNEERHAPTLLRSLLAQDYPGPLEIVFVLDRCTDATRVALESVMSSHSRRHGVSVRIVDNVTCPDDWAGKCNAARVGAELDGGGGAAWLLFTDADTRFDPALVRSSVALAAHRGLSLLSAMPQLTSGRTFERVAQPVAALQLMKLYPPERVNRAHDPRPFANGQFMLFLRETYDAIGGHASVRDDLLEDIAFARRVHEAKRRFGLFMSDGMLITHMYESAEQFREGWARIFIEACHRNPTRLRRYAALSALIGIGGPLACWLTISVGAMGGVMGDVPLMVGGAMCGAAGIAMQHIVLRRIYRLMRTPRRGVWLHWLGSASLAGILWRAASLLLSRQPVRWGGRTYVLAPRYSRRKKRTSHADPAHQRRRH